MVREVHSMGSRSRGGHPTGHSYPQRSHSPAEYSAIDDYGPKYDIEYEDPYYERPPDFPRLAKQTTISTMKSSSLASPPLPPPISHSTMQRLYCGRNEKQPAASVRRFKLAALFVGGLLLVLLLIGAFLWHVQSANARRVESMASTGAEEELEAADRRLSPQHPPAADRSAHPTTPKPTAADPLVSSNLLATLFAAQRKVCLFEVSTAEIEESRADFVHEHIDGARLLLFSNLTHSGVPVHPLQFQRSIRNQGVDSDCHVVLYDRGQQIWASYAFWIFNASSVQLFGHEKTSVLNGGLIEWKKRAKEQPNLYRLNAGAEEPPEHFGSFRAAWDARFVHTFDDVVANFHSRQFDLIDAQTPEEYTGKAKGATFGHIRTAVNLPIDEIFDWQHNTWPSVGDHLALLNDRGITGERPVVLYDGVSLKSTMIFFALRRAGLEAGVFFGGWPEFAVRAPDSLKVIPNASPSSD
ncbi:hypothetical protein M3Y99_01247000 [Aphelenchoides fujianensis]|nr:hypothetical protein M3Y99_01247000 [Aphelenchoides fujianensis]